MKQKINQNSNDYLKMHKKSKIKISRVLLAEEEKERERKKKIFYHGCDRY